LRRQKLPDFRQHRLKFAPRSTWTKIVAAKLFDELDVAMDKAQSALDARLGWEALTPFARRLESKADRRNLGRVP
jgi:hypothetical protein